VSSTHPGGHARLEAAVPLAFVLLWSSAFIAARAGLPYASPVLYLALRFTIAAAVLAAILALMPRRTSWRGVPVGHLVVGGILINGLYLSGAYIALETISAATMALIGAFHPLATAILGHTALKERMRALQWMGLAVGLGGVVLVVGPGSVAWHGGGGLLFAAGGVACLAVGTVYHRMHCRDVPAVHANAVQQGSAAAFCLMAALLVEDIDLAPPATLIATLLYLALVVSIGAMALFIFMLRKGTAGQVSSNFYLTPGITAVMGWLVLGESLEPRAIAGFAVASLGVWLANRRTVG
jgi:drug/metabolite transporter (DMT)-like permease